MVAFGMAGIAVGLALSMRYQVLVLIPVQMLAILVACIATMSGAAPFGAVAGGLVVFMLGLQTGYLGMSALRPRGRLARSEHGRRKA